MKKVISILLVAMMLSAMFVMPASAAGNGAIALTSTAGAPGETVTMSIVMPTNPGLVTMELEISYDTSVLELKSVADTGLLEGIELNETMASPYKMCWIDGATEENNISIDALAELTFEIKEDAAFGDTEVELTFISSYDVDTNANTFTATSGVVSVVCDHDPEKGFCTICGEYCSFPDVREKDWHYKAVEFAVKKGYFSGRGDGKFGPGLNITRQDFVVVLSRIAGADLNQYSGKTAFTDVSSGAYYAKAIHWATANGVISGYNATKFGVGDSLTREQLVTILWRYAAKKGANVSVTTGTATMNTYPDAGKVNSAMRTAVAWALQNGVIGGMQVEGKTSIAPQASATRAQTAQILMNINTKGIIPGI